MRKTRITAIAPNCPMSLHVGAIAVFTASAPAHGTAFDIAGQEKARVEALSRAFAIACRMGESRRAARES